MKLLVVVRWPVGGIRTYMAYMYRSLARTAHITVVAPQMAEHASLQQDMEECGIRLVTVKGGTAALSKAVLRETLRSRPHCIQSHGFISGCAAYPAVSILRIPHVLTIHGIVETHYLAPPFSKLKWFGLNRMLGGLAALNPVGYAISNHVQQHFSVLRNKQVPVHVIQNGIDTAHFTDFTYDTARYRKEAGLPDHFTFGFVGRFMPQKGFDLLVEAVSQLGRDIPFTVAAVGNSDFVDAYRREVTQRGLDDIFRFLPHQRDIRPLFSLMDVLVMPSRWEAYPLVPVEAMCAGVPLIATSCIGLAEAVEGTPARVIPPEDANALAGAMRTTLSEYHSAEKGTPLLQSEAQQFIAAAAQRFAVSDKAEALSALLRQAAAPVAHNAAAHPQTRSPRNSKQAAVSKDETQPAENGTAKGRISP